MNNKEKLKSNKTFNTGLYSFSENINKRQKRKCDPKNIIISGIVLLVILLFLIFLCKGCNNDLSVISGIWIFDQYTEYEFDGKGNGCMCLDGNNHFEFRYKINGDVLSIDFKLDYVKDCQYTFTVSEEKLTLVGGKGTAEIGKIYELSKKK